MTQEEYLKERRITERSTFIGQYWHRADWEEFKSRVADKQKLISQMLISDGSELTQKYEIKFEYDDEDDVISFYLVYNDFERMDEVERRLLEKDRITERAESSLRMLIDANKDYAVKYIKELGLV